MSDHEIASNEVAFDSRKVADCIVEIKNVEGEVYQFQTDTYKIKSSVYSSGNFHIN
ncbi:MAG: hypothetical protein ACRCV0_01565 [Brevinema sp.]